MTKRQMREIRRGIILAKSIIELPGRRDIKIVALWAGLPGDSGMDRLRDRAYRRTAVRYLQKWDG